MFVSRILESTSRKRSRRVVRAGERVAKHRQQRRLDIESLEDRRVLSADLSLVGINANDGTLLAAGETRTAAPTDLTLVFSRGAAIDPATLDGIQIVRSGFDGVFGPNAGDEVDVAPGFIGLGEESNEVIVRFAESLPDDAYEIRIAGSGDTPLATVDNCVFNGGQDVTVPFELDLGAQVVSVVPQPITRAPDGSLSQATDRIDVYFNDDDLDLSDSVSNREFFQLVFTGHANGFDPNTNTLTSVDDEVFTPSMVNYDPATDKAELTFSVDLDQLSSGVGTYRLRIGSNESMPMDPRTLTPQLDAGSSFDTADTAIGTLTRESVIVSGAVEPEENPLVFPGSNQDPGHRQVSTLFDLHVPEDGADIDPSVPIFAYNFQDVIGFAGGGSVPIQNLITENQKELARQVFEVYAHYLGLDFVETADAGLTVATGDVRAVVPGAFTDPELVPGVAGVSTSSTFAAVMNSAAAWSDDFNGNYYQEAMRQIGRALGLGASNDLPDGTIQGSNPELTFERTAEPIFPGDHDIVHGRYLYRPDGNDIDLYRFQVSEPGMVSIETFAERRAEASSLDTVVRLYRQTDDGPVLVSQNDDYFGEDSRLHHSLDAGTYFVGVSSKGNDRYNPVIENTGAGGTSQGEYDLRLDFRPDANQSLVDTTGQPLDGDGDGQAGGSYNFWFRVQDATRTIFVDKSASNGDGSLESPFNNIRDAVAAADANNLEGEIIRVVGNNLGTASLTDDLPYEIGFDSFNTALADGGQDGSLRLPSTVTLMIDEGAIFKLRRGAIIAGSSSPFVDNSGASVQVLGTPEHSVIFTSFNDESIGVDSNPLTTTPIGGDWGGILLRNDLDVANQQFNYETSGIFLNAINFADMRYGGGIVSNGFISGVVNPITMIGSRATVTNNHISFSADAAMSASPNTFLESTFQTPAEQGTLFTADYSRIGPDIRANVLLSNTTNGLGIANRFGITTAGLQLTVSGRFDDTSIVHVIQDNLEIVGGSGGALGEIIEVDGQSVLIQTSRPDGSLVIDPGTVVKVESASVTVGMGANLLAEGTNVRPVVITSLQDDRFGFGGTFNTNGDNGTSSPEPGDWAGIYFSPTSSGSFDHSVVAYGGGVAPIPGTFTGFNVIESHQGALRVTNSTLEFNGQGIGGVAELDRGGLGRNEAGTIFVAGEQPIVVDNVFRFNDGAIVNINVNSLNHESVVDLGRSTGLANVIGAYQDNQGALVRNNEIEGNGINGMVVRGGTLTTESVWDDVDAVHVLFDTVFIPNFHSFGGLRLKSSPDASLVVKLLGENTGGFVATGTASGVPEHIGGSLQVIGQPGSPVIMTSFFDDTVGAGFDSVGDTQVDTDGGKRPIRTSDDFGIQLNFGPVILQNPEVLKAARKAASLWEAQFQDPINVSIDVELADVGGLLLENNQINEGVRLFDTDVEFLGADYDEVRDNLASDAGAHEALLEQLPSFDQLNVNLPADPLNPFELSDQMFLSRANAKALQISTVGSDTVSQFDPDADLDGTILINDNLQNFDFNLKDGLATYREDFETNFLRQIGRVLGFESGVNIVNVGLSNPAFNRTINITPLDLFRFNVGDGKADFTNATRQLDPRARGHVFYAGGDLDFTGFPIEGISNGEIPLSSGFFDTAGDNVNDSFGAGFWLDEFVLQDDKLTIESAIGVMDPRSGLRDGVIYFIDPVQTTDSLIVHISEADRLAFDAVGYDAVGPAPGQWEGLRFEELANDRNVPVYPEIESPDSPVPGPNDSVNSAEFIGNLAPNQFTGDDDTRLGFEIHGLISAPGDADVYRFAAQPGTEVWIDIDNTGIGLDSIVELVSPDGTILAGSDNSVTEVSDSSTLVGLAQPFDNTDIYTTNIYDAGMKATLPGPVGIESTYFVRVRAAGETPEDVAGGKTAGRYELQLRLQAEDEVPGSSVTLSEIRYAQTGVRIIGPPTQSPLLGEHAETGELNDVLAEGTVVEVDDMGVPVTPIEENTFFHSVLPVTVQPQRLGNVLASRQGAFSVFGTINEPLDVDWYQFELNYDDLALPPDDTFPIDEVGLVFDVDYADGLSRPDTVIAVYDVFGQLMYFSNDSNLADDQAANNQQLSDLSRGSLGQADPFIGPVVLDAGRADEFADVFGFSFNTYYVAVSSAFQLPTPIADASAQTAPVVGDANRGLEVTSLTNDTTFSFNPSIVPGVLTGEYQLEIRTVPIPQGGFTTETATAGDSNRPRPQGQIVISSNIIRDSSEWGITIEDAFRDLPNYLGDLFDARDVEGTPDDVPASLDTRRFRSRAHTQFTTGQYVPHAGPPRAIPGLNEERLIPGITISNNLVAEGREGGLQIHGDPNGIMITTYDLNEIFDVEANFGDSEVDGTQFVLWDHQRNSQTFEFDSNGAVNPGRIPIRFNGNVMDDAAGVYTSTVAPINPPTVAFMVANELEHVIRGSDLDVKVYRGEQNTLFIEGAVEIGDPDVVFGSYTSVFFPRDSQGGLALPIITADKVQQGAVPYARVVNNTLVGQSGTVGLGAGETNVSIGDIGIQIEDNASPTLLNNVVANFDVGVLADLSSNDSVAQRPTFVGGDFSLAQDDFAIETIPQSIVNDADVFEPFLLGHGLSTLPGGLGNQGLNDFDGDPSLYVGSRPTIIGGTLYKGNLQDTLRIGIGDFPLQLSDQAPLFVDASTGNYFLAEDSLAIDSSISFLPERGSLNQLLSFLDLESEGITAPEFDVLGVARVDDPRVEPPVGLGTNVFIDRGAIERADFVGPLARLVSPLDNDPRGVDQDDALNAVAIFGEPLTEFEIELSDSASPSDPVFGSGIDDQTVTSDAVTVVTDDRTLVAGVDYIFAYNSTSDTIRLTPVAGIWDTDTVYLITVDNTKDNADDNTQVRDRSNNPLQANQTNGMTQFVVATGSGADFGDAPDGIQDLNYPTRRSSDGARHTVVEGVFLGQGVDFEVDAVTNVGADADDLDDGVTFTSDPLIAGAPLRVTVDASVDGLLNAWIDFDRNGSWDVSERVFSDEPLAAGDNDLVSLVPSSAMLGDTYARFRFSTQSGLQPTGEAPDGEVEDYLVTVAQNPWQNPDDPFNVDDQPGVGPTDALFIINVLTSIADGMPPAGVDGTTGQLEIPRPADAMGFIDVNGDGFVTPLDALHVINALPNTSGSSAVRAPSSAGAGSFALLDDLYADEDESLEGAIGQIAGEVGDIWGAE